MPGTGPQPTGITGFTIDVGKSDLDPSGGISLKGTYTHNGSFNPQHYSISAFEDGVAKEVKGSFVFNSDGTFTFSANQGQTTQAGISKGDKIQFKLIFNNGTSATGDDQLIAVSNLINIVCYYPGTMIATPTGEVPIEDLAINDLVLRHDGEAVPVRWIGRNTVSRYFADDLRVLPIRMRRNALAENVPSRDLLVSPDHAVLVDDILAQAAALLNGSSIIRENDVPTKFVYYHIELSEHALILAENTPAESFIDNVDRMAYDNWAEHEALYGDASEIVEMDLPRAKSQRQIPPSIRKRLADRAVELGYSTADTAAA
jgi:hypothetical protein